MRAITKTPESNEQTGFLINRDFALLWFGGAISVLGDFFFDATLVVWIAAGLGKGASWSPAAVSAVLIAAAAPTLVIGPIAGVFVDRWDKHRILIRMNLLCGLGVLVLLPFTGIASVPSLPVGWTLGAIYTVVLFVNTWAQFLRPASLVMLGDIVPDAHRPRAASMNQVAQSFAMLIAPALSAPLFIAFGAQWALLINAGSFLVAFGTVRAIDPRPRGAVAPPAASAPPRVLDDLRAGLRFFRHSRVLMTLAIALVTLMLGAGALNALDIFFVTRNLGAPVQYFGLIGAAQGVGMLLGAALAGSLARRIGLARLLWVSLVLLGAFTLVYARMTHFIAGMIVTVVIGLLLPAINVAAGPIILHTTPRELQGRVSGTLNPLVNGASILGSLLGGLLYSAALHGFNATALGIHFGPLDTIFTAVGLLIILSGLYAMTTLRGEQWRPTQT